MLIHGRQKGNYKGDTMNEAVQLSVPTTLQPSGYNVSYRHLKGNKEK